MTVPTAAVLVAELEARSDRPLTFLVLAMAEAPVRRPPGFLPRGLAVTLDADLRLVEAEAFGAGFETAAATQASDLPALAATAPAGHAARVLFVRNRALLGRVAGGAPTLLRDARAVLVQAPAPDKAGDAADTLAALLAPFGLERRGIEGLADGNAGQWLFERPAPPGRVRLDGGYLVGEIPLEDGPGENDVAVVFAGERAVGIAPLEPGGAPDRAAFRVWAAPELLSAATPVLSVERGRLADRRPVWRLARPGANRFVPESLLGPDGPATALKQRLGVLLLASPGDRTLPAILRRLADQGAQPLTHLRLDGPAGDAAERIAAEAAALGFADRVAHRGAVGREKSAVQGLWRMAQGFHRVVVLDGTTMPHPDALDRLAAGLDGIADRPDLMAVDGHRRSEPCLDEAGWAARSDRLEPLARQLAWLFSLEEEDYRAWSAADGPPADAFRWGDALARLAARVGLGVAALDRPVLERVGEGQP